VSAQTWGVWVQTDYSPEGHWLTSGVVACDSAAVFRSQEDAQLAIDDCDRQSGWVVPGLACEPRPFTWDAQPRPEDIRR